MRFGLLGALELHGDDGRAVPVREVKVRMLLAVLLAGEGRVVSSDRLIEALWPDGGPRKPSAALQVKVSQLRRALDTAAPDGRRTLVSAGSGYRLDVPEQNVDFRDFGARVTRALRIGDPAARVQELDSALALWRGEAFADFAAEPFALTTVAGLEEQRLIALEERAHGRLTAGEQPSALAGDLAELVERHPRRERLWTAHLTALARSGRPSEALAGFARLREQLVTHLGTEPGPELTALHRTLLHRDEPGAAGAEPPGGPEPVPTDGPVRAAGPEPADAPEHPHTNVPVPLTDLVGRDTTLSAIERELAGHRLVTLVGPGGVGKTRLALAMARRTDVAWLVELSQVPPATHGREQSVIIAEMVAATLGLHMEPRTGELGPAEARGLLLGGLRERRMLLVLDGCEHVLDHTADLVRALLSTAPGVRVLATSQELLGVTGEKVVEVAPLDLPADDADPDSVTGSGAVALFVERARAAAPQFAPDRRDLEKVAALCRRLDGLPLAIEMAATRVRAFGLDELLRRLDDRFRLLTVGRPAVPRHQTLRATIEWSWGLCTLAEQTLLARMSLFMGSARLESAEEVGGGGSVPVENVLDLLGRLVDRSLVAVVEVGGGVRYRLWESVAAYGREQLTARGELETTITRLAHHYTALADRARSELGGADQGMWLTRLDEDAANLEFALCVWHERGEAAEALRHVTAMAWYWFLRGRLVEGQRMLRTTLDLTPPGTRRGAEAAVWHQGYALLTAVTPRQAAGETRTDEPVTPQEEAALDRARWFLGYARWALGSLEESAVINEDVLRRARARGDMWGTAAALVTRTALDMAAGDLAAMDRDGTESAELFKTLGDRWGQLKATDLLGVLAEIRGDHAEATLLHEEGLRIAHTFGMRTEEARKLAMLGRMALLTGDLATADELHRQSARLAREQAHLAGEQFAEFGLALSARRRGGFDEAERLLAPWVPWLESMQAFNGLALVLAELGFVAEERGDLTTAVERHRRGLDAALATADRRAVALALEGLAGTRGPRHPADAARLLGAAGAARTSVGAPLPDAERRDVDRITAAARAALGDAEFDRCLADGARIEQDRAASGADPYALYADLPAGTGPAAVRPARLPTPRPRGPSR